MFNTNRMLNTLLMIVVCSAVIILFNLGFVAQFIHSNIDYRIDNTVGISMKPNITPSDKILVKEVDSINEIEEGDVVTFSHNCRTYNRDRVVHRVVNRTDKGLITQGDNVGHIDQNIHNPDYLDEDVDVNKCLPYVTNDNIDGIMVANVSDIPFVGEYVSLIMSLD